MATTQYYYCYISLTGIGCGTVYFGLFVRGKRVFHDFAFRPMGIYKVATFGIKHFGLTLCFLADSFEDSSNLYGEWSVMCQSITFFIGIRTTDGNLLYLIDIQRQCIICIFQQYDGFAGCL